MALPKEVSKDKFESDVPETAREHYTLDEASGVYHLGLVPKGELAEFRTNNIAYKKKIDELTEQVSKFGDLDPSKVRSALAELKELKANNGTGKFTDEDLKNKVEERTAAMRESHAGELKKLNDANTSLQSRLTNLLVNQKLSEIAVAKDVGLKPEAIATLQLMAKDVWSLDDSGEPVAKKDGNVIYGTDGQPLKMKDWIIGQRKDHSFLFNEPVGSGANNRQNVNTSGLKRKTMTTKQKSDYIQEHGQDSYEALPWE